jgi:mannose-6-phosphate isomerase-like protein (cupin superfamily)
LIFRELSTVGERLHGGAERLPLTTVLPDDREVKTSASYYTVAVGDRVTAHYHEAKNELWFIVSGQAIVRLGDESFEASAGTAVITPPGVVHGVERVIGPEPLVFVNFASPPATRGPDGTNIGTVEVE